MENAVLVAFGSVVNPRFISGDAAISGVDYQKGTLAGEEIRWTADLAASGAVGLIF
jgi:hypothetical protein